MTCRDRKREKVIDREKGWGRERESDKTERQSECNR